MHLQGGAAAPAAKGGGAKGKDLGKKAALLSGPPGIGKTIAAHIIAREAGFEVVEMNASDTRNKAGKVKDGIAGKSSNVIKEMATNTAFSFVGAGRPQRRRQLLVMDEVDGMSGGDRGGVQDLIDTIKKSKIPIICICNDKYNQSLRSVRNHCLELEFRTPQAATIAKRMAEVCAAEGLAVNQNTLESLVTGVGGDLRLVLGQLQMVRLTAAAMSYDQVKGGGMGTSKDTEKSPFECARKLLESSSQTLSMGDKTDLVFADLDLVPLLVAENYVNHRPIIASDLNVRLRALAKAADGISQGDIIVTSIRRYQNWSLALSAVVVGTVMPAAYMRGGREAFGLYPGEPNFPRFTALLGNLSTSRKHKRLLGELATTMAASGVVSSNRSAIRLEYASALRHLLTRPLLRFQEAAIPGVAGLMHEYGVDREQFDYIIDVTSFKSKAPWAEDPYKEVPTKVKTALTRNVNSTAPAARCTAQVEDVKISVRAAKGKGKGRRAAADDDEDGNGDEQADPQEPGAGAGAGADEDEDAATFSRRLKANGLEVAMKDDSKPKVRKVAGGKGGAAGGKKVAAKK